jgi:hypothetical protein
LLYKGETVRLLREISEAALPLHSEGTVSNVVRNEEGYPLGVQVEFYTNSKSRVHTIPFDSVELVLSSAPPCTGVFWGLQKTPQQLLENAMHAILDYGFSMREGLNVLQLHYNREERFWEKQDRFSDATGAHVVTAGPAWDGCLVAFSGRQRFHLEFRFAGRAAPYVLLHERYESLEEQRRETHNAMTLMRVLAAVYGALGAEYCAMPVAGNWLMDQSWNSLLQQPYFPDFFMLPQSRMPETVPSLYRATKLMNERAVLTSLPVKFSPAETGYKREERDLKLNALRACKALGEKAYDQMYDAHSGSAATGLYSDAKEAFYEAIRLADELELAQESAELSKRLEHIKAVFRSQFS